VVRGGKGEGKVSGLGERGNQKDNTLGRIKKEILKGIGHGE